MTEHRASCRCGALTAVATGDPGRVSVCHCLDCQRRTGSAFSAQARFPDERVVTSGPTATYETRGSAGTWARFHFCPTCGTTVFFQIEALPGQTAIPLGTFDNPHAFTPVFSVFESRKHDWLAITGDMEHD